MNSSKTNLSAHVAICPPGGPAVLDTTEISARTIHRCIPDPETRRRALGTLEAMGFEIEWVGTLHIQIAAPASLYKDCFDTDFEICKNADSETGEMFIPTRASMDGLRHVDDDMAEIVFPWPTEYHQDDDFSDFSPVPPPALLGGDNFSLASLRRELHVQELHDAGIRGEAVTAALIDSGFDQRHPFFDDLPAIETHQPGADRDHRGHRGHGTRMSALFLSMAPDTKLHGLLASNPIQSFGMARDELGVQIISSSWGLLKSDPQHRCVLREIALCVDRCITVLFSSGNKGQEESLAASMAETISVGGVRKTANGLEASQKSLSYENVPDVCGLVGSITQPVPPHLAEDPKVVEGWINKARTSQACATVAGVAALILSKHRGAAPEEVRRRLRKARDVKRGVSANPRHVARCGKDEATGCGLVDAVRACVEAQGPPCPLEGMHPEPPVPV